MPTIADSTAMNRTKLQPVVTATPAPAVPDPAPVYARNGNMRSSLPPVAAGADQFLRQFYGSGRTIRSRVLPARKL